MCNLKAKNYVEFPFTFCLPSLRSLGGNKNLNLDDSVVEAEELEKKRLLDACSAVQTTTIERNSSKYRVDAKRMYREYTR